MTLRDYFPASTWIWRKLTGRIARRLYTAFVLLLLVVSAIARVNSFLLTRKIRAVISGLSKLHIDETNEDELARTVPYLIRSDWNRHVDSTLEAADIDTGDERIYYVTFSNERGWMRLLNYAERYSTIESTKDGHLNSWILTAADLLGYRYTGFSASVILFDGKVSKLSYEIEDHLAFPRSAASIVSVRSAHSYWGPYRRGIEISSTDDESPQFRVGGGDRNLYVTFLFDAPPELQSHVFQVDLSCFWGLLACRHARQVAPLLWHDKDVVEAATLARLKSNEPCPERIIAGRVRYLPDVSIVLIESLGFKSESVNNEWPHAGEIGPHYKLIEVVRGRPSKLWESVNSQATVLYPGDYLRRLPNSGLRWAKAGEKVLAFSNFQFDSCALIPATPAALTAIRDATVAPRRAEDEAGGGLM